MPLVVLLLLLGCGGPWGVAKRVNSIESYANFVANYPTSSQAEEAHRRAEVLRWKQASDRKDASSYRIYLYAHPDGSHAAEATSALEHAMYREARDRRAYESYLLSYPAGAHAAAVKNALEGIDWDDARRAGTAASFARYILHHPQGQYATEARKQRDDLLWEEAVAKDSVHSYRYYLMRLRTGAYRPDAEARIAELIFTRVKVVVRVRSTWRSDGRTLANNLVREVRNNFATDLTALGFDRYVEVLSVDLTGQSDPPHPLDAYPITPGTGLIIVDIAERRGEEMRSVHATILKATVSIYASARREPMASEWVEQRTASYLDENQEGMNRSAEVRIGEALIRAIRPEHFLKERAPGEVDKSSVWSPTGSARSEGSGVKPRREGRTLYEKLHHQ
jgi:hypothetical protein